MTTYVIRVGGSLSDEFLRAFPQMLASKQTVSTVLQGDLPDQSALSSVLDQLDELGVEIIDFTSVPARQTPKDHDPEAVEKVDRPRAVPTADHPT